MLGESSTEDDGIQYTAPSPSLIRNARRTMQLENHLFRLLHSGYTGLINSGEGDKGVAARPFEFHGGRVDDPEAAREMVESLTRPTVGTEECSIESCRRRARRIAQASFVGACRSRAPRGLAGVRAA